MSEKLSRQFCVWCKLEVDNPRMFVHWGCATVRFRMTFPNNSLILIHVADEGKHLNGEASCSKNIIITTTTTTTTTKTSQFYNNLGGAVA